MTRFMTYNIYRGGENGRLPSIIEVVREARPDVLGILEASSWQEQSAKEFAGQCDFAFSHLSTSNTRHRLALFGKTVPKSIESYYEGFWHSVIHAVFATSAGDIHYYLCHLDYRGEDERAEEMKKILGSIPPDSSTIITGDFNSLSPHDPYNREELLKLFQVKGLTKFGTGYLRFDVVSLMEQRGMVDAATLLNKPFLSTTPTPSNRDVAHLAPLRLDYLFVSKSLVDTVGDAAVIKNGSTDKASDHYPIIVDCALDVT